VILAKVEVGLSAQRIYQDLVEQNGFSDSCQSVKRFVRKLRARFRSGSGVWKVSPEKRCSSILVLERRPIEEWGKLLSGVPAASAILGRLLHHAEVIAITGRSCRVQPVPKQPTTIKSGH
jgi:hypothetical protein